jgi:hypothetical protein
VAEVRDDSDRENAELRAEIRMLREQIKEAATPLTIIGWKIDRIKYRAFPLMSDGKPRVAIPLRPLFEMYHEQTSS